MSKRKWKKQFKKGWTNMSYEDWKFYQSLWSKMKINYTTDWYNNERIKR